MQSTYLYKHKYMYLPEHLNVLIIAHHYELIMLDLVGVLEIAC